MIRNSCFAVLISIVAWAGYGPTRCEGQSDGEPRVAAYGEAFGNTGLASVNMDLLFENGLLVRFGGLPLFRGDTGPHGDLTWTERMNGVYLVTMIGTALGDGPVRLETGLGFTFGLREVDDPEARDDFGAVTATLGLRHQPLDERLMFRIGFTPRYSSRGLRAGLGFSLGVTLDEPDR